MKLRSILILFYLFFLVFNLSANIGEQLRNAPSDPSFIYEDRFIPGNEKSERVQPIKKQPIINNTEPEKTEPEKKVPLAKKRTILDQIPKINLTQIIAVSVTILIFVLYKLKNRKRQR